MQEQASTQARPGKVASNSSSHMQDGERLSDKVDRLATGRWREVLIAAGVPEPALQNKKGPCPVGHPGAANRKAFRFDDKSGSGTWICSHCGAGKGMALLINFTGWTFVEASKFVIGRFEGVAPQIKPLTPQQKAVLEKPELTESEIKAQRLKYKQLWRRGERFEPGTPPWRYLERRCPGLEVIPNTLRAVRNLEYWVKNAKDEYTCVGKFWAIIAAVQGPDGVVCNIHRTYLTEEGEKLSISAEGELIVGDAEDAEPEAARKLMKSIHVKGGSIRLGQPSNGVLGIAEGWETALCASILTDIPMWSVISTSGMVKFVIPADVNTLYVFRDYDRKCLVGKKNPVEVRAGFKAADELIERPDVKERIANKTLRVFFRNASREGWDMADVLRAKMLAEKKRLQNHGSTEPQ